MHDFSLTTTQKGPRLYLARDKCPTRLRRLNSAISHIKAEGNRCGLEQKHGLGKVKKLWTIGWPIDRQMDVRCLRFLKISTEDRVSREVERNEDENSEGCVVSFNGTMHACLYVYQLITLKGCTAVSELETKSSY